MISKMQVSPPVVTPSTFSNEVCHHPETQEVQITRSLVLETDFPRVLFPVVSLKSFHHRPYMVKFLKFRYLETFFSSFYVFDILLVFVLGRYLVPISPQDFHLLRLRLVGLIVSCQCWLFRNDRGDVFLEVK